MKTKLFVVLLINTLLASSAYAEKCLDKIVTQSCTGDNVQTTQQPNADAQVITLKNCLANSTLDTVWSVNDVHIFYGEMKADSAGSPGNDTLCVNAKGDTLANTIFSGHGNDRISVARFNVSKRTGLVAMEINCGTGDDRVDLPKPTDNLPGGLLEIVSCEKIFVGGKTYDNTGSIAIKTGLSLTVQQIQ